jgi:Short C-terminal domain
MMLGKITVFASGNKAEINNVSKADGKAITDAVRARLTEMPAPTPTQLSPATSAGEPKPDIYEQLAKLGELRKAGVLTDEEFEAKKVELLGRI